MAQAASPAEDGHSGWCRRLIAKLRLCSNYAASLHVFVLFFSPTNYYVTLLRIKVPFTSTLLAPEMTKQCPLPLSCLCWSFHVICLTDSKIFPTQSQLPLFGPKFLCHALGDVFFNFKNVSQVFFCPCFLGVGWYCAQEAGRLWLGEPHTAMNGICGEGLLREGRWADTVDCRRLDVVWLVRRRHQHRYCWE